jgi:phospholipid/cholesterol/gamma-HCH transport system substrate-binding protein
MSDKFKNILIGAFTMMSVLIIIGTILFMQPSIGDGKKIINVRFSDVAGISIGTRVNFAGKAVGEVKDIIIVKDAREENISDNENIYCYQLILKVDSSVEILDTDIVCIQTIGLMGEKSVGIVPKSSNKNSRIITNEIIYAKSNDSFEDTAIQISKLSNKAEKAIDNFNDWFNKNSDNLSTLFASFSNIAQDISSQKIVSSLNSSITSFNQSFDHINNALKIFEENKNFDKINLLVDNMTCASNEGKEIFQNIKTLSSKLNNTDTGLGKLLNGDEMFLQLNAILSKANTLFNDINNYGLLFQYSKGWQRLRTKKANILESLNNPMDFKNFFEKEISEITTSLSRIDRLVEKASDKSNHQKIMNSENFKKNFGYLLRKVESLHDIIKLYNESLENNNSK